MYIGKGFEDNSLLYNNYNFFYQLYLPTTSYQMVSHTRKVSKSVRRKRSSSDSECPCDYLKLILTKRKLRCICDALDIHYDPYTSKADLCTMIEVERPDLMRGWKWNVLRTIFSMFDFQNMNLLKNIVLSLITGVGGLYPKLEVITYLIGKKNIAVGYGLFALQRRDARKYMGYDTRKRSKQSYEEEKHLFLSRNTANTRTPLYSQLTPQETNMLKKCLATKNILESLTPAEEHSICLTLNEAACLDKYKDTYAEVVAPSQYKVVSRLDYRSRNTFFAVPKTDTVARSGKQGHVWFHARLLLELCHKKGWLNTTTTRKSQKHCKKK